MGKLFKLLFFVILITVSTISFGQPGAGDPNGGGKPGEGDVPIGGIEILLLSGAALGVKRIVSSKKRH